MDSASTRPEFGLHNLGNCIPVVVASRVMRSDLPIFAKTGLNYFGAALQESEIRKSSYFGIELKPPILRVKYQNKMAA